MRGKLKEKVWRRNREGEGGIEREREGKEKERLKMDGKMQYIHVHQIYGVQHIVVHVQCRHVQYVFSFYRVILGRRGQYLLHPPVLIMNQKGTI